MGFLRKNRKDESSLGYLAQALWTAGKIPNDKLQGFQFTAAAADYALDKREMVEGQIMETENKIKDIDSYHTYAEKKTASLFVLSAKIPLIYYGINDDKILEFTKEFGLLFQISNDIAGKNDRELSILNFISNEEAIKTINDKEHHLRKMYPKSMNDILEILDEF